MKLKHLRGNIYAIKGMAVTATFGTPGITANSLFIDDAKRAVIDPASDPRILEEIGRQKRVDYCFLTHAHLDHICSLSSFPGARVHIHQDEDASFDGISYGMLFSKNISFFLIELWKKKLYGFRVHKRFKDMETFEIGNTLLQVIHAPGHTAGHSFFYFPNERILYSGDFDLSAMGPSYSYKDSSFEGMSHTAQRVMDLPIDIWVSGHWRYVITSNIKSKIERFIGQIKTRDERLLAQLKTPYFQASLGGADLVLPAAIIKDSWLMQAMERKMISRHLKRLQKQGRVRKTVWGKWVST